MSGSTKWSQRVAQSLSKCGIESAAYAGCVVKNLDNVEHNICNTEFQRFKQCIAKNSKR